MAKYGPVRQEQAACGRRAQRWIRGFSLLELLIVCAIVLILSAIAIPLLSNALAFFRLRGATSAVTGTINKARYQAISQGIQYQTVFTTAVAPAVPTVQVLNQPVSPGPFVNFCPSGGAACPAPLTGSGTAMALGANITLTFTPGGQVLNGGVPCNPVTNPCIMQITYGGKNGNITISRYGNATVVFP
jgi:prepilin-type N-terminal cleavage/methylation domain-containing protein